MPGAHSVCVSGWLSGAAGSDRGSFGELRGNVDNEQVQEVLLHIASPAAGWMTGREGPGLRVLQPPQPGPDGAAAPGHPLSSQGAGSLTGQRAGWSPCPPPARTLAGPPGPLLREAELLGAPGGGQTGRTLRFPGFEVKILVSERQRPLLPEGTRLISGRRWVQGVGESIPHRGGAHTDVGSGEQVGC